MKRLFYLMIILLVASICSCSKNERQRPNQKQQDAMRLMNEGHVFENRKELKQALVCYWNALDLLTTKQDTLLKAKVYNRLGDLLFKYGLYEKAVESHREGYSLATDLDDKQLLLETTHKLSMDYALLNQSDTAQYFHNLHNRMAAQCQLPPVNLPEVEQLKNLVVQTKADSINSIYEREQLLNWEAKYKRQKAELLEEQANNKALVLLACFLSIVCLLLILLYIMYWLKKKEKKQREEQWLWFNQILNDNKTKLETYQAELFDNSRHIRELQQTIEQSNSSLQQTSSLHEELQYYMTLEADVREKERTLRLREKQLLSESSLKAVTLLNQMKNNPTYLPVKTPVDWQTLIEFMDLLYDDYSRHIYTIKELTERDQELCFLIRLGFTTGQLAIFYGISPSSVTKAKFRIQKKVEMKGNSSFAHIQIA